MACCLRVFLQELNQRAQGEVTIREALRELDIWGAGAVFTLTDYEDSQKAKLKLIKDWKEIVNQVDALQIFRLSGSEHQKLWNFEKP